MTELRRIRKALGLSQNALSAVSGIAATKLSAYECGDGLPSASTLIKLADSLGCSIDALLGRAFTPPELAHIGTDELAAEIDRRAA